MLSVYSIVFAIFGFEFVALLILVMSIILFLLEIKIILYINYIYSKTCVLQFNVSVLPKNGTSVCGHSHRIKKVQVGKDQEKAQSAKDSHSKSPRWEKTKLTIRYLYHENIS